MRRTRVGTDFSVPLLLCSGMLLAQSSQQVSSVPKLIRVTSTFHPANSFATSPVESITASIYSEEKGGGPLWSETQNVSVDSEGRYTALLGSTLPDGLPSEIFATGAPRWLGIQFNRPGEGEQPRLLLVSVPYALKAGDAETLGGRPASAYLLASAANDAASAGIDSTTPRAMPLSGESSDPKPTRTAGATSIAPKASSGTANCVGLFVNSIDLGCSVMWQSGSRIGVGTSSPGAALDVIGQAAIGSGGSSQSYGFDLYVNGANPTALLDAYGVPGTASLYLQGRTSGGVFNHQLSVNGSGLFSITPSSTGIPTMSISQGGILSFGTTTPWPGAKFQIHSGVDQNLALAGPLSLPNGVTLHSFNDAISANKGLEFRGSPVLFSVGNVGISVPSPVSKLDVGGDINLSGALRFQGIAGLLISNGKGNTALGPLALGLNTTGTNNSASGYNALAFNSSGQQNTGTGGYALFSNGTGSYNTATGYGTLQSNTSGSYSTATGFNALATTGGAGFNTADGANALYSNTLGQDNTASGFSALYLNSVGSQNTASGYYAMYSNTFGGNNTAVGFNALYSNSTGSNNIALGYQAGYVVSGGSNNIHIGSQGIYNDNSVVRIGTPGNQTSFFVAGVAGANVNGAPVLLDAATGQLGVASSSRRYKDDIEDMGEASRGLLHLRPVTFRYKQPLADGSRPLQFGLVAEEVAEVFPELVARSADGQIETVKYQLLEPMLLNELQRQQAEIRHQRDQISRLEERLDEQGHLSSALQERLAKLESTLAPSLR